LESYKYAFNRLKILFKEEILSAAGVLVGVFTALTIGFIVFVPKIFPL
jgi:hypothetical protein